MGRHLGYTRVSTDDQELMLQVDALKMAGCKAHDIYSDTAPPPIGVDGDDVMFAYGELAFRGGKVNWVDRQTAKRVLTADNWKSKSNKRRKALRVFGVVQYRAGSSH